MITNEPRPAPSEQGTRIDAGLAGHHRRCPVTRPRGEQWISVPVEVAGKPDQQSTSCHCGGRSAVSRFTRKAMISSQAAAVGSPAVSTRCAVTTLCGQPTICEKNGGGEGFAASAGSTRGSKRGPSAAA